MRVNPRGCLHKEEDTHTHTHTHTYIYIYTHIHTHIRTFVVYEMMDAN